MTKLRGQVIAGVVMLAIWLGIGVYVVATRPDFRDPFGGGANVSLFWFLMVLLFAWNALRILTAWQKSFDRPKPPIRRTFDDEPEDPSA